MFRSGRDWPVACNEISKLMFLLRSKPPVITSDRDSKAPPRDLPSIAPTRKYPSSRRTGEGIEHRSDSCSSNGRAQSRAVGS
jgi:hypothetical protein